MGTDKTLGVSQESASSSAQQIPAVLNAEDVAAWELVDTGRYRPRRIRGSFRGRELG